jgi:hypothetical protein
MQGSGITRRKEESNMACKTGSKKKDPPMDPATVPSKGKKKGKFVPPWLNKKSKKKGK